MLETFRNSKTRHGTPFQRLKDEHPQRYRKYYLEAKAELEAAELKELAP